MDSLGDDTVGPPQGGAQPRPTLRRRMSHLPLKVTVPSIVIGVLFVGGIALAQESGYMVVEPGPTWAVKVVPAPQDPRYDPEKWRLLTVAVDELTWMGVVSNALGSHYPLVTSNSAPPSDEAQVAQMLASSQTSTVVAHGIVTQDRPLLPSGAAVLEVEAGSPADAAGLLPGDLIVAVDGTPLSSTQELVNLDRSRSHALTVTRGGETVQVQVTPQADGMGLIVEVFFENLEGLPSVSTPGQVGGASGGLIYALALIDAAQNGDLSGGKTIAATGTLYTDGTVGRVLGAEQKALSAARDGASVMFVPSGSALLAPIPEGLEVVEVSSVQDAVSWLCAHGGQGGVCDLPSGGLATPVDGASPTR